jgi:hypothetical protein
MGALKCSQKSDASVESHNVSEMNRICYTIQFTYGCHSALTQIENEYTTIICLTVQTYCIALDMPAVIYRHSCRSVMLLCIQFVVKLEAM